MQIYVVTPGDSVDSIAQSFGIPAETIIYNNQLEYPYPLAIGQALLLTIPEEENENRREAWVNGYAYPFIEQNVLEQTLPYLSALSVFSYGFTSEGYLLAPWLPDQFMIEAAFANNVYPVLTLTPFGPDGRFSNVLISQIVNSMEAQQTLLEQLKEICIEKGFLGVDIDFEYILPEDRVAFANFVENVRIHLEPFGIITSVALAPKISDTQSGLLYEGKDYALLGAAADRVLLMTYEWGYTYGPPMAVAPINKVREVVEYAVTKIPTEKINLGIPNYGYDWTLPFVRGESAAVTISNVDAVRIAIENNAEIEFDETAKSPYFYYEKQGEMHEVWFEDVRSMQAKFDLVEEFGLEGMGYWQVMRLFRANWLLLADRFLIRKL